MIALGTENPVNVRFNLASGVVGTSVPVGPFDERRLRSRWRDAEFDEMCMPYKQHPTRSSDSKPKV
jgi:hypothetical protein